MHITFDKFSKLKYLFALLALVIVGISGYFTNGLVKSMFMMQMSTGMSVNAEKQMTK